MTIARTLVVFAVAASLLGGCSSFKKLTGQRNDTVLPGEREDILPPDQQVNPKVGKNNDLAADAAGCDPTVDVNCAPNLDQEAAGDGIQ